MSHSISSRYPALLLKLQKQPLNDDSTQIDVIFIRSSSLWIRSFQCPDVFHSITFIKATTSKMQLDVPLKYTAVGWKSYTICNKRRSIIINWYFTIEKLVWRDVPNKLLHITVSFGDLSTLHMKPLKFWVLGRRFSLFFWTGSTGLKINGAIWSFPQILIRK